MAVSDYKTNPDENTTISGINIAEGCPPSGINNAIRQLMADVKQNSDDQSTEFSKVMTGATAYAAGTSGNVPAPQQGQQNKPLTGSGTFGDILDCNITGNAATATRLQGGTGNLAMPIGAIYIQYAYQKEPSELFGGIWQNISSSYSGQFFRAEGGEAATFNSAQSGGAPEIYGYMDGGGYYAGQEGVGALFPSEAQSSRYIANTETSHIMMIAKINIQASRYNALYGSAQEIRPLNSTVRIWLRTA